MFKWFYNFGLFLALLFKLPRLFNQKYRHTLLSRLGLKLPQINTAKHPVIWIHAISMGETRAVIPLFQKLKKQHPDTQIFISTATETGLAEAKKSMADAHLHFLLPFDFSWIMKKLVNVLQPHLLILVESDFWHNMLQSVNKRGGKTVLINGKISERSFKRFHFFKFFAHQIFSKITHFCLQNETYKKRFIKLGIDSNKCTVTGNIKFDFTPKLLTDAERDEDRSSLGIKSSNLVVVIGSTHPREEEMLLTALELLWKEIPHLKVLLVPRHPERFSEVEQFLHQKKIDSITYTERASHTGKEKVILINTMGKLNQCYQLANAAIVGGSFVDHVGGHNILEPVVVGVPVLFGPHMHSQPDLTTLVLNAGAGIQLSLEELPKTLLKLLKNPSDQQLIKNAAQTLTNSIHGATDSTFQVIEKFFH
ncbi:MAG: 3-deoxy-D-manno-octulosonic acid transferase [Chlamydiota bacterium]